MKAAIYARVSTANNGQDPTMVGPQIQVGVNANAGGKQGTLETALRTGCR
jgi:hypothetical protein